MEFGRYSVEQKPGKGCVFIKDYSENGRMTLFKLLTDVKSVDRDHIDRRLKTALQNVSRPDSRTMLDTEASEFLDIQTLIDVRLMLIRARNLGVVSRERALGRLVEFQCRNRPGYDRWGWPLANNPGAISNNKRRSIT